MVTEAESRILRAMTGEGAGIPLIYSRGMRYVVPGQGVWTSKFMVSRMERDGLIAPEPETSPRLYFVTERGRAAMLEGAKG